MEPGQKLWYNIMEKIMRMTALCIMAFSLVPYSVVKAQEQEQKPSDEKYKKGTLGYILNSVVEEQEQTPSYEKYDSSVRLNLNYGFNFSQIPENGFDGSNSFKFGIQLGIGVDVTVGRFHLMPSLQYISKGNKSTDDETWNSFGVGSVSTKRTWTLHQIEVPYRFGWSLMPQDADFHLVPYAGVYFAFGLGGKYKAERSNTGSSSVGDNSTDFFDLGVERVDIGYMVGMRFDMPKNKFYFEVGFEGSILNNYKYEADNTTYRNMSITFTGGFDIWSVFAKGNGK